MATQQEIKSIRKAVKDQVISSKGITATQIQSNINVDKRQINNALKFLQSQSIIEKEMINKSTIWKSTI